MFQKMRRIDQELDNSEVLRILTQNTSGVLSVVDGDGYPYGVPLSYVYIDNVIYFHSANSGRKIDAIKNCDKAAFCIIDRDDVIPEKYTTRYKSVIAFGRASIASGDEKLFAIRALGDKYYPDHDNELQAEIDKCDGAFTVIKFEIEHMTGKRGSAV